ncbi:hypothetical protein T4C_5269 [Trichinella pseudospiralis]|uniref:Uncharacterized protein n=1 Tax=Trichinella pseudospiralis TaxID=6337 RepID=A0A0V1K0X2_TRIPS|nr:hypothetical protein T4C_5269 [Trichinella pseudospiralis]
MDVKMRLSAEKRFLQTSWYVTTLQWCTEISGEPAVMKQAVVCRQWKCMLIKVASLKIYSAQDNVSGGCALRPDRMVSRGFARRRCVVTSLLKSRYDRFSRYLDQLAVDKFQHSIGLREKGFL